VLSKAKILSPKTEISVRFKVPLAILRSSAFTADKNIKFPFGKEGSIYVYLFK